MATTARNTGSWCAKPDFDNATLTQRGLAAVSDDPGLPRVTVARSTNIIRFLQKCLTRYEDSRRRR